MIQIQPTSTVSACSRAGERAARRSGKPSLAMLACSADYERGGDDKRGSEADPGNDIVDAVAEQAGD
jgi:hypothetical protein